MDIQKLKTFVDLTKTLSYTETAERLFTTQATISKHIISLEKELGVKLFNREHRTIEITTDGNLVLSYAETMVATYDEMSQQIAQSKRDNSLDLTIKAIPSISKYKALELISEFHRQFPEVNLHLSEAESYELVPALRSGEADIIFVRTFSINHTEFEAVIGEMDKFVVVIPKSNSLANRESIKIDDLKDESFLMLGKETNLYEPVMKLIQSADFTPKVTYEGKRVDLVLELVNKGMGVSLVMDQVVDLKEYPNIVKLPLIPELRSHLAFVRRKGDNTEAGEKFWKFFQSHESDFAE